MNECLQVLFSISASMTFSRQLNLDSIESESRQLLRCRRRYHQACKHQGGNSYLTCVSAGDLKTGFQYHHMPLQRTFVYIRTIIFLTSASSKPAR